MGNLPGRKTCLVDGGNQLRLGDLIIGVSVFGVPDLTLPGTCHCAQVSNYLMRESLTENLSQEAIEAQSSPDAKGSVEINVQAQPASAVGRSTKR